MTAFVVRHIAAPERLESLAALRAAIPNLVVVEDQIRNAMHTFQLALAHQASNGGVVHLEDDIMLCDRFVERVEAAVAERPDDPIQFFSRRGADAVQGSRWMPGSSFSMNQAFYLPRGMSGRLLEFSETWSRIEEHPTGYDLMMADAFKSWKQRYWLHVPSLVQHRVGVSLIDRRRAWSRQSATFEGGLL